MKRVAPRFVCRGRRCRKIKCGMRVPEVGQIGPDTVNLQVDRRSGGREGGSAACAVSKQTCHPVTSVITDDDVPSQVFQILIRVKEE